MGSVSPTSGGGFRSLLQSDTVSRTRLPSFDRHFGLCSRMSGNNCLTYTAPALALRSCRKNMGFGRTSHKYAKIASQSVCR
jgi:hypothetical protein